MRGHDDDNDLQWIKLLQQHTSLLLLLFQDFVAVITALSYVGKKI